MRHLEGLVRDFVEASIAPSTAQVYATGQRRYLSFCRKSGSNPIPLSENQMCLFVAHLADEGLQHSSIKGYLSAVRRMQIVFGLGDPFVASWPLLECTLRGIKLGQAKRSTTCSQPRLPIPRQSCDGCDFFGRQRSTSRTTSCAGQLVACASLVFCDQVSSRSLQQRSTTQGDT